jgi:predicted site-specific integrase-resolvase
MSERRWTDDDDLLTPGEVAGLFRVDPKTVTRWARAGRIPSVEGRPGVLRTPGGHMRYRWQVVRMILDGEITMNYAEDAVAIPPTPVTR